MLFEKVKMILIASESKEWCPPLPTINLPSTQQLEVYYTGSQSAICLWLGVFILNFQYKTIPGEFIACI